MLNIDSKYIVAKPNAGVYIAYAKIIRKASTRKIIVSVIKCDADDGYTPFKKGELYTMSSTDLKENYKIANTRAKALAMMI